MDAFALLKILSGLLTPPASLALAVLLALAVRFTRWRRLAGPLVALGIAHVLLLSFPPVADALLGPLEAQARQAGERAPPCCYEAIVVLGGALAPAHPPEQPLPDLKEGSDRVWEAARLWRRGIAPRVIVSGGSFLAETGGPPTTEAEAMRAFLLDLGVPTEAIVNEGKALNTIENMRNVRAIVGSGRVALVTSASHMPRALELAALAGLDVAAFPVDFLAVRGARLPWDNWIPTPTALEFSVLAMHEIVARLLDFRRLGLTP